MITVVRRRIFEPDELNDTWPTLYACPVAAKGRQCHVAVLLR